MKRSRARRIHSRARLSDDEVRTWYLISTIMLDEMSERGREHVNALLDDESLKAGMILNAICMLLYLDWLDMLPVVIKHFSKRVWMAFEGGVIDLIERKLPRLIVLGIESRIPSLPETRLSFSQEIELDCPERLIEFKAHVTKCSACRLIEDLAALPVFAIRHGSPLICRGRTNN